MYEFLHTLGVGYQSIRAAQDAGIWFVQIDKEIFSEYVKSFLVARGFPA